MLEQKAYSRLETLTQLNLNLQFKFAFCANNAGFARYLFQVIVLVKSDFNCGNKVILSL